MTNNTNENQDPILNDATEAKDAAVEATTTETAADAVVSTDAPVEATQSTNPLNQPSETPVHNPDEFDWSMDGAGFGTYDDSQNDEMKAIYTNTIKQVDEKTLVTGKIVGMTGDDYVIDIGFKSDGLVAITEFRDTPDIAVGDEVEVYVDETENALGQLILSRKKAIAEGAWERIQAIMENGEIVKGYIQNRTKGGLVVDVMGMDAFLPGSQIDVKPVRDYDQYVGKTMEFKVVKINEVYKNVVISHKAIIEDDIEAQKAEMISKMEVGQVLEGTVKNMTSFGVFVDLGGLDGLLHITDISWGRINHPEDVLELDQKIQVAVLEFDNEKKRISLGMKQLTAHPWDSMKELKEGEKVKGKVVTVADYGAFVEIEAGVEGLVHVSEMSWSQHLRNPSDFIKVGDEVEAVILDIDKEEHKLSLGLKQLTSDPWEKIEEKYPMDSKHAGIVRNLTNYGLFVELEEGVDGLVHVSDLSWSKKIKHPAEFTKKGEELEVVVLEIDRDNRRLSLGHKQIDENPWDTFSSVFTLGSEHEGVVSEINDRGVILTLPYGVEGFSPKKHIKKEDKTDVVLDETVTVRVIEFNKDAKRILVSHTDIWKDAERAQNTEEDNKNKRRSSNTSKFVDKMNKSAEKSTLGELDVLAQLKAKMDAAPKSEPKAKKVEAPKAAAKKEDAPKEEAPKAEAKKEKASDDLSSMTVAQLKAVAKEKGITGYTSLKKAELIEVLSK
ncbi:30S ribosomal protein S1 [Bacteroidia bacterium]|nr:30S ribosomal protein S1 [Bacteroidia bacterium]